MQLHVQHEIGPPLPQARGGRGATSDQPSPAAVNLGLVPVRRGDFGRKILFGGEVMREDCTCTGVAPAARGMFQTTLLS